MTKQILYLDKQTGSEGHVYLDNVMANKNSFILINIFLNYHLLLCILETGYGILFQVSTPYGNTFIWNFNNQPCFCIF